MNPNNVTVIIPCYNDGIYIDETVNSVLSQTYENYTIFIVDDGSEDVQTNEILNKYVHEKIKVYRKKNGGVSSARNYGIKKAESEYILVIDADDKIDPSFIETAVTILNTQKDVGLVNSYYKRFGFGKERILEPKNESIVDLLIKNTYHNTSLYRYKCWLDVGGYDEKLKSHEDWNFLIAISKIGWNIYTIDEPLAWYRQTNKSKLKSHWSNRTEIRKRIFENHEDVYKEYIIECLYEKEKLIQQLEEKNKILNEQLKKRASYKIMHLIRRVMRMVLRLAGKTYK